jgi:molybdopterin synthase catalytic subunit
MRTQFLLLHDTLETSPVQAALAHDSTGAQVIFVGTVRDFSKGKRVIALDFEAYEPVAIKELEVIAMEMKAKWSIHSVVLHHALGKRLVGEVPVIAGVSAPHRKEAFEACEYLMNRLKESVPIWKKEIFEDGEEWVSATP